MSISANYLSTNSNIAAGYGKLAHQVDERKMQDRMIKKTRQQQRVSGIAQGAIMGAKFGPLGAVAGGILGGLFG